MSHLLTAHNIKMVGGCVFAIISAASAFCASTPTPDKTTLWGKVYTIIEWLALNIGKAKQIAGEAEQAMDQTQQANK